MAAIFRAISSSSQGYSQPDFLSFFFFSTRSSINNQVECKFIDYSVSALSLAHSKDSRVQEDSKRKRVNEFVSPHKTQQALKLRWGTLLSHFLPSKIWTTSIASMWRKRKSRKSLPPFWNRLNFLSCTHETFITSSIQTDRVYIYTYSCDGCD